MKSRSKKSPKVFHVNRDPPPGADLDKAIYEHIVVPALMYVKRLERIDADRSLARSGRPIPNTERWQKKTESEVRSSNPCLRYSTDHAAAFELVRLMRVVSFSVAIDNIGGSNYGRKFNWEVKFKRAFDSCFEKYWGLSEELPYAISIAALKWPDDCHRLNLFTVELSETEYELWKQQ